MTATTKTTAHTHCTHPATKSERAKCRKARNAAEQSTTAKLAKIRADYYSTADDAPSSEEIIFALAEIDPKLIEGYYENTRDLDDIIFSAIH